MPLDRLIERTVDKVGMLQLEILKLNRLDSVQVTDKRDDDSSNTAVYIIYRNIDVGLAPILIINSPLL